MRKKKNVAKRNAYIIGIFIVFIMVGSILGLYAPEDQESTVEYNSHTIYRTEQSWFVRIGQQTVSFFYIPQMLENITVPGEININAEKIYLATDNIPELNLKYTIDRLKGIFYYFTNLRPVDACINEEGCPESFPIISCNDATAQVLYLKKGNETKGYVDNQCITVEINANSDIDMVSERLIYKILKIMD